MASVSSTVSSTVSSGLAQLREAASGLFEAAGKRPWAGTAMLRAFGLTKIPMLWFLRPSVVEWTSERCVVRLPYNRRTRNHLKAMYIGALVGGADCAGGLTAMRCIRESGRDVHLLFRDLKVTFTKRVEGDAYFTCEDGAAVAEAVRKTIETGERADVPLHIVTTVPDKLGDEPAAHFEMTLTLKCR